MTCWGLPEVRNKLAASPSTGKLRRNWRNGFLALGLYWTISTCKSATTEEVAKTRYFSDAKQTLAMTSFRAEKCCHVVNAHAASARRTRSSVPQFTIHSTVVLATSFCSLLLFLYRSQLVCISVCNKSPRSTQPSIRPG